MLGCALVNFVRVAYHHLTFLIFEYFVIFTYVIKFRVIILDFRFINHILDGPGGPIKENNIKSVVSSISVTPLGLDVLYEFLSTNINKTLDQLSNGEEIVTFIYSTLASKMTNNDEIEKVSFKNHVILYTLNINTRILLTASSFELTVGQLI